MKHYQDSAGKVHGIDETDPLQAEDRALAEAEGWIELEVWPLPPTQAELVAAEIIALERQVTDRMIREQLTSSTNTFAAGPFAGLTSAQAIASIQAKIVALRVIG